MKKLIALSPLWDADDNRIWMRPTYPDAIRDSGGIPVILPLHISPGDAAEILDRCDGLILTGGPDVHPALFGEEIHEACGSICPARDTLEQALYRHALERDMPVLGICRGIQTINVFQGGTLYQDLPTEKPSDVSHNSERPYDRVIHHVNLSGPLRALLGVERLGVNSIHHQAVKDLGEDLEVMAVSDDQVVEALRHKRKKFVWGVQWHPEFSFQVDENSRKIVKAFVDACESFSLTPKEKF